jgi:hypothetical protein
MRGFQAAATELAFARDRTLRSAGSRAAGRDVGGAAVERRLLLEATAQRYVLLGSR